MTEAPPVPPLSPVEMQILVSRTGLVLNPGQVADLVLAWRQVAALVGGIPRTRPLADDLAGVFRLPSPKPAVNAPVDSAVSRLTAPSKARNIRPASPGHSSAAEPRARRLGRATPAPDERIKPPAPAKARGREAKSESHSTRPAGGDRGKAAARQATSEPAKAARRPALDPAATERSRVRHKPGPVRPTSRAR